jgi:Na+/H+ antiporter NhaD/arsenite permease-like protein
MIALATFILCYICFVLFGTKRAIIAMIGAAILLLTRTVSPPDAVALVHWNVVGLFFGTLILAELFMQSHMPAVMAEWVVNRTKTARGAVVAIAALASVISIFVENVAVVLLIAPIAIKLCEKIKLSPIKPIIFLAIFSNIQGTATLIGDPPSMILAGYLKMNFMDFFIYQGKTSIFFFVQAGALAALLLAAWMMHRHKEPIQLVAVEQPRSLIPSCLLFLLVALLTLASLIDPNFTWFAGASAMSLAAAGLIWYVLGPRWTSVAILIKQLDWDTSIFLIGVFILVGALIEANWITAFAEGISPYLEGNLLWTYFLIITFSVVISAFIDNVPYLLAMIPVVQNISDRINAPIPLLIFALLIGSCLGGNITPIGASANIVAMGILKKHGHIVSFNAFTRIGIIITLAAVAASSLSLWLVWS